MYFPYLYVRNYIVLVCDGIRATSDSISLCSPRTSRLFTNSTYKDLFLWTLVRFTLRLVQSLTPIGYRPGCGQRVQSTRITFLRCYLSRFAVKTAIFRFSIMVFFTSFAALNSALLLSCQHSTLQDINFYFKEFFVWKHLKSE